MDHRLQFFYPGTSYKILLLLSLILALAACGGGGGKTTPTPTPQPTAEPTQEPDITPEEFTFELPAVDPAQGESVAWPAVEISSLGEPVTISISGGEYAIDGGAFTSEDGTVTNGQSIVIRATAASAFDGEQPVSITVGDYTTSFTLTTESQDLLPDTFSFAAVTEAERGAQVASPAITVAGINDVTAISIVNGEYALDGGDFISTAGQVMNGQSVAVRVTASSEFSSTEAAELTIGGVAASFSVTTLARDVEPDAFSFVDQTDVEPESVVTSAPVTISGINDAADISITGGEYAIDGGNFTSAAGMVSNGQEIVVRLTAANTVSLAAKATLTVSTTSAEFTATTFADTEAPVAELHFPIFQAATYKDAMTIRGIAEDNWSDIADITVNGIEVTTTDNFANWQVSVPLAEGDNAVNIVTSDSAGNTSDATHIATITRQVDFPSVFPAAMATSGIAQIWGLTVMGENNETLVFSEAIRNIYSMNTGTGEMEILSPANDPESTDLSVNDVIEGLVAFELDGEQRLMAAGNGIFDIDVQTGTRTVLSGEDTPDTSIPIEYFKNLIYVPDDSPYLLAYYERSKELVKIELATGTRSYFTDLNNPDLGEVWDFDIRAMAVGTGHVYVSGEYMSSTEIYAIDMTTGQRSFVADKTSPNADARPPYRSLSYVPDENKLYGIGYSGAFVQFATVDLTAGENFGVKAAVMTEAFTSFDTTANGQTFDAIRRALFHVNYSDSNIWMFDIETAELALILQCAD